MPNIDLNRRSPRRPGTLEIARAERALVPLARGLAALAGFIDAVGFLAFGQVFLASPEPSGTILGVSLAGGSKISYVAGAVLFSFFLGVVLTTLCTFRLVRFRRTAILSGVVPCIFVALLGLEGHNPYVALALLAATMGALHCVFERDPEPLREALYPSTQIVRMGEALGSDRRTGKSGVLGQHCLFWLSFIAGGTSGAIAWVAIGRWALALTAIATGLLAIYTGLVERNLGAK
jgi:uncharacterized membrane protein YoaK (UPF0700 family)